MKYAIEMKKITVRIYYKLDLPCSYRSRNYSVELCSFPCQMIILISASWQVRYSIAWYEWGKNRVLDCQTVRIWRTTGEQDYIRQGTCNSVHCSWFFISLQRTSQLANMTIIRQGTCNSVHCTWFFISLQRTSQLALSQLARLHDYHQTRYV